MNLNGTNIASGFTYHPNGSVAGVAYGNGQVFSQTLTPRLQTDRLRSVKGAELPVDLTYTYTPRSQIASISDRTVSNIDQSFLYDGLGNICQRSVAARTVGMSFNATILLSARHRSCSE